MKQFYSLIACMLLVATPAFAQKAQVVRRASTTLERPTVLPATNITSNAFTANWNPVPGAEAYCVYVYIKDVAPSYGEYTIVDEDFNGIDFGSLIEPAGGDEYGVNLSEMGYAFTYGWEAYAYPNFVPSMVAGLLYSPFLVLKNTGGNYRVHLTTHANRDDQIRVESHGSGEKQVVIYTVGIDDYQSTGMSTQTLDFDNGTRDLFFSAINVTAQVGQADYIDRVQVTQDLLAGDVVYTNIAADDAVMAEDDWGTPITSKRFTLNSNYLNGKTEVYYDVYAAVEDWSTPNGSTPYTLVTSPYSQKVLVNLQDRTSEVVEDPFSGIADIKTTNLPTDDNYYDLTGRRVANPTPGIYIHQGKKVIIK